MVYNALKLFKLLSGSGPEPQELLINLFRYKLIAKSQRKKRSEMPIVLLARAMKIQTIIIIIIIIIIMMIIAITIIISIMVSIIVIIIIMIIITII